MKKILSFVLTTALVFGSIISVHAEDLMPIPNILKSDSIYTDTSRQLPETLTDNIPNKIYVSINDLIVNKHSADSETPDRAMGGSGYWYSVDIPANTYMGFIDSNMSPWFHSSPYNTANFNFRFTSSAFFDFGYEFYASNGQQYSYTANSYSQYAYIGADAVLYLDHGNGSFIPFIYNRSAYSVRVSWAELYY